MRDCIIIIHSQSPYKDEYLLFENKSPRMELSNHPFQVIEVELPQLLNMNIHHP